MPTPTIDDVLDLDPVGKTGSGDGPDEIADGYYRLALRDISMPYKKVFPGSTEETTICKFTFEVIGEPDYDGGVVPSAYDVSRAQWEVKADVNGPKSNKYQIWSAIIGQDYYEYATAKGPVKPSQLINQECWGRIENSKPKDPNKKPWPNVKAVFAELPEIAIPKKPGAARPPARKPF